MVLLAFLPEIAAFLMFIMMATQLPQIGPILILCEFALVGLLLLLRTRAFMDVALRWWWLLGFAILAPISALWSEVPGASARYGIQFLFTCMVGVLLARLMTPKRFICTLMVSMFVFCILCIMNGRLGSSASEWVLIGLTGSKNQMGYAAQVLLLSAIAVLLMRDIAKPLRWIALIAVPLGVYLLNGTNSATAVLMAVGGSFVLIGLWWSQRLPPGGRLGTLLVTALILAPLTALIPEAIEAMDYFLYNTLDKDPTLTGRIFLWEQADILIANKPILGHGFQAIWMGDSSVTIGLKRLFNIEDGRQFHFHHQFRQLAVDLGIVGMMAFVIPLFIVGFSALRQVLLRPSVETSFFFVLFALMVARSFTDIIIGPFSVHTLLFFACCVYAFWRPEQEAAQASLHLPIWRPIPRPQHA